jgi:hypothetical protein
MFNAVSGPFVIRSCFWVQNKKRNKNLPLALFKAEKVITFQSKHEDILNKWN